MKYRLGMLAAALALSASTVFAGTPIVVPWAGEVSTGEGNASLAAMTIVRASTNGVTATRDAWLKSDRAACNNWTVWGDAFGLWGNQSSRGTANTLNGKYVGYDLDAYGFTLGFDRNFGQNLKIGIFGHLADGDLNNGSILGILDDFIDMDADITSWSAGAYGVYTINNFFVEGLASYVGEKYNWDKIRDDQKAYGWNGKLTLGYQFNVGCDFFITPTVGLDYIWMKNKAYNRINLDASGLPGFNLPGQYAYLTDRAEIYRTTSLELPVMINLSKSFATGFGKITPYVRGGWIHEFHNGYLRGDHTYNAGINGNLPVIGPVGPADVTGTYTESSYKRPHDYGTVGLGVNANINGRADIGAGWDYQWASRYHQNMFNFTAGVNF